MHQAGLKGLNGWLEGSRFNDGCDKCGRQYRYVFGVCRTNSLQHFGLDARRRYKGFK